MRDFILKSPHASQLLKTSSRSKPPPNDTQCHPHFERLSLGRGNRLYNAKHLLGGCHVRHAHLAVCGPQFQPVTVCHGFISLGFETLFQLPPVGKRILAFGQHRHHIDNGEVPNLRLVIPNGANLSVPRRDSSIPTNQQHNRKHQQPN